MPTDRDIADTEGALVALVKEEFERRPWMTSQTPYFRQYAGFERGPRKVIYLNAIADSTANVLTIDDTRTQWRTEAVNICDGGAVTFGAVYDTATRRFDWFQTNGPYNGKILPASR